MSFVLVSDDPCSLEHLTLMENSKKQKQTQIEAQPQHSEPETKSWRSQDFGLD
jgi:hypothetical protein